MSPRKANANHSGVINKHSVCTNYHDHTVTYEEKLIALNQSLVSAFNAISGENTMSDVEQSQSVNSQNCERMLTPEDLSSCCDMETDRQEDIKKRRLRWSQTD